MTRSIRPRLDAAAWVSTGRWGPRRVRIGECLAMLKAESVYTVILQTHPGDIGPGLHGSVAWTVGEATHIVACLVRPNAVWRHGRVFLTCPKCGGRVTRLYVPTTTASPACRRCWGLTYTSRTRHYGPDRWLFPCFGSFAAYETTLERERRRAASAERYAVRRALRQPGEGRQSLPRRGYDR